jgi:hypothetical protein
MRRDVAYYRHELTMQDRADALVVLANALGTNAERPPWRVLHPLFAVAMRPLNVKAGVGLFGDLIGDNAIGKDQRDEEFDQGQPTLSRSPSLACAFLSLRYRPRSECGSRDFGSAPVFAGA